LESGIDVRRAGWVRLHTNTTPLILVSYGPVNLASPVTPWH
jgi:hypothetical protein